MKRLKAGNPCPECNFEMVEISREAFQSMKVFEPKINSIPRKIQDSGASVMAICPRCDAYALGIDMQMGFSFTDKDGNLSDIHKIKDILWNKE